MNKASEEREEETVEIARRQYLDFLEQKQKIEEAMAVLEDPIRYESRDSVSPSSHSDDEARVAEIENPAVEYEGPTALDLTDKESTTKEDSKYPYPSEDVETAEKPIRADDNQSRRSLDRMNTNRHTQGMRVFQKFTFWAGTSTLFLLIALIPLNTSGILPVSALIVSGIILLAASTVFFKIYNDIRS